MNFANVALLGALASSGCFTLDIQDGVVQCNPPPGRACPQGYYCANGLCYHNGHAAPSNGDDMASSEVDMAGSTGGDDGGATDMATGIVNAPRLIRPMSTSWAVSRRPSFQWVMNGGSSPVVDICGDRACTNKLTTAVVDSTGTSAAPSVNLPAGVVFWRVTVTGPNGPVVSNTWELFVPNVGATVNNPFSSGTTPDVNGDGYADLIVGADGTSLGKVHVFLGSAQGLQPSVASQAPAFDGPDGMSSQFGFSVSSAGDVNGDGFGDVIVGAPASSANSTAGRAHIYFGGPNGLQPNVLSQQQTIDGPDGPSAKFGWSVAGVGDVNGDGYGDVAVSTFGVVVGTAKPGRVHVYFGGPNGIDPTNPMKFQSIDGPDGSNSYYGFSVATGGDLNGDGYADMLVAAPAATVNAVANAGRVHVYLGTQQGFLPNDTTWTLSVDAPTPTSAELFGYQIAWTGDTRGNGYSSFIVGTQLGCSTSNAGSAFVYRGFSTGLEGNHTTLTGSDPNGSCWGQTVGGGGDIDGDGFWDIAVGAQTFQDPTTHAGIGRAHAYLSGPNDFQTTTPGRFFDIATPDSMSAQFGQVVSLIGDVNGDGFAEVAAGSQNSQSNGGAVHVYMGSATGIAPTDPMRVVDISNPDGANGGFGSSFYKKKAPQPAVVQPRRK